MVDWTIEVMGLFDQNNQTIFRALHLMDLFLKEEKQKCSIVELHLLGIVCMFISSKLCEVFPIRLARIVEDIGKNKFSKEVILGLERHVLRTIGFKMYHSTIHCFSSTIFKILELPPKVIASLEEFATLIQKMFLYSYDILNVFTYHQLALYSIIIALKLLQSTNHQFRVQKIIYHLIQVSEIPRNEILENLNFLRDFASNFQGEYSYNKLQTKNLS